MLFTSQEVTGGNSNVWAVRTAANGCYSMGAAGSSAWNIDVDGSAAIDSDIDAGPSLSADKCRLYVASNRGEVYSVATGKTGCGLGAAGTTQ